MLHGHAKIELTNVKTGKKKVIEHDNMLTNWLRDILTPRGIYGDCWGRGIGSSAGSTAKDKLFGGLVMFRNALSSDADDYKFPTENVMIAHGDNQAYNGTDLTRGSYNSNESVIGENSATFVWDFNQEHGNGTISSLGLCNIWGGLAGAGQKDMDYNPASFVSYRSLASFGSVNTWGRFCYCDFDNGWLYGLVGQTSGKITIKKYAAGFGVFNPLVDTVYNGQKLSTNCLVETKEIDISAYQTGSNFPTWTMDGDTLCIITPQSDWASGTSKTIVRIKLSTWEMTTQTVTNNTGKTLYASYGYSGGVHGTAWAIWNGCLYAETSDRKYAYINLSDNTDCGLVVDGDGEAVTRTNDYSPHFINLFGNLFISPLNYTPIAYYNTGDITMRMYRMFSKSVARQTAMSGIPVYRGSWTGEPIMCTGHKNAYGLVSYIGNNSSADEAQFIVNQMCLTTKQNLETAVTKTADMTMRVTYTIQEVSE